MQTTKSGLILAVGLLSVGLAACGGDSVPSVVCGIGTTDTNGECTVVNGLECGEGTFEAGGECTPFDPTDDQAPTTTLEGSTSTRDPLTSVRLVSEPGSLIYFTTDGTEPSLHSLSEAENVLLQDLDVGQGPIVLKFFAMDEAGNREVTQSATLSQDLLGPGAVTNLALVEESDGSVTLTWTNPDDADFQGVVVMREGKQTPLTGGTLAASSDVLYVGNTATLSDTISGGLFHYSVRTYDSFYNYGDFAGLTYDNPAVLTDSTGWILASDGTVTAGSTPSGITFDVVSTNSGSTFKISATNETLTTFHAPKVLLTNLVNTNSGADGTVGGDAYVRLGARGESLVPGATLSGTVSLSYVTTPIDGSAATATIDLRFRHDGLLLIGDKDRIRLLERMDEGTLTSLGVTSNDGYSSAGGKSGIVGVVSQPGSRFVWGGNRNTGVVRKIDSESWSTVASAVIGGDHNFVSAPFFGPSGLLWVALSTDGPGSRNSNSRHFINSSGECFLVGLDPASMTEVRRILLGTACRLRVAKLIPNTSKAAVVDKNGGQFYIVDLTSSATAPVTVLSGAEIISSRTLAISPDGNKAYLAADSQGRGGDITVINLSTQEVTSFNTGSSRRVLSSGFASDGKLWLASRYRDVITVDTNNVATIYNTRTSISALVVVDAKVYILNGRNMEELDAGALSLRSTTLSNRNPRTHALDFIP